MDDLNKNDSQKLIEAVKEFKAVVSANRQIYQEWANDTRRFYEDMRDRTRESNTRRFDAYIIAFVSVFVICVSISVASYFNFQAKKSELLQVQLIQQLQHRQENMIQKSDDKFSM